MDRFVIPGTACPIESIAADPGRRQFLRGSFLGMCAAAIVSPSDLLASPMVNDPPVLGLVSNHGRFTHFSAAAEKAGLMVVVRGDSWSAAEQISKLALSGRPPILAATCQASFTVLSQVAMESGYRLAYVGDHRQLAGGETQHSLRGDHQWLVAIGNALVEDSWEQSLYPVLRECLLQQSSPGSQKSCVLTGPGSPAAATDPHWRTWVMVPTTPLSMVL